MQTFPCNTPAFSGDLVALIIYYFQTPDNRLLSRTSGHLYEIFDDIYAMPTDHGTKVRAAVGAVLSTVEEDRGGGRQAKTVVTGSMSRPSP